METKNTVKVTRELNADGRNGFFNISFNGRHYTCRAFRTDAEQDDPYNEEKNKQEAIQIAKELESNGLPTLKTIYETPTE